ncbi:MAG TPA: DUF924 domain-containing protein [Pseudomonadales bacterium]|nr:DUF924 domain-containing protein [Pseudomonadales bacterium]
MFDYPPDSGEFQHCLSISCSCGAVSQSLRYSGKNEARTVKYLSQNLHLLLLFYLLVGVQSAVVADTNIALSVKQKQFLSESDPRAMDILKYWFEEWEADMQQKGKGRYNDKWFPHGPDGAEGSRETDRIITERFLDTFHLAIAGELGWDIERNPYENLAYVILLDQFTRNMFRGTEQAYEHDHLSRTAAKTNIEERFYKYYFTGYQKMFVVYPLMHHENLESQELSLQFLKAINEHPNHPYEFLNAFQKGVEHFQIIHMFGRFPHRNVRRDRPATELESLYVGKKGTAGFVDGSKW